jgi:hypothetical protein
VASPETTGVQQARVPLAKSRKSKGKPEIRAVTPLNLTPSLDYKQNSNKVICLAIVGAHKSWAAALIDTNLKENGSFFLDLLLIKILKFLW